MLLPTDFFIAGGGVVVAMTFLIAVLIARKSQVASENNSLLKVTLHSEGMLYLSFLSLSLLVFFGGLRIFGNEGPAGKSSAAGALDWLVGRLDPDHGGFGRHLALGSSLACS